MGDGAITTTRDARRCPACGSQTPSPLCPVCGGRYARSAGLAALAESARLRVEALWWALAVASTVPVVVEIPDFRLLADPPFLALLSPGVARAARMAWRGRTRSPVRLVADVVSALVISYFVVYMTLGMAIGTAFVGLHFGPAWLAGLPGRAWYVPFVVIHLLYWPLNGGPRCVPHHPDDPRPESERDED